MKDISYTYALIDPVTFEIRYIGITVRPKHRLSEHIRGAKNNSDSNIHKSSWINNLLSDGLKPKFTILESCHIDDAPNSEVWWINLCRSLKCNLTNLTDGGDCPPSWEGKNHTEETKKKQSRSIGAYYQQNDHPFKGTTLSESHLRNVKVTKLKTGTFYKCWASLVPKDKKCEIYQKRTDNKDWRKNLSRAAKKRLSNPINNPMYGKKHSAESIEKNRLSNQIYAAYKKGDYDLVTELQEDYLQLTGHYQSNYSEFTYQ